MWEFKWPLLAITIALISAYIAMAEYAHDTSGPRTFVAALAAVCLGAWLYALARDRRGGKPDKDDSGAQDDDPERR